jgi:hypothetical protein
MDGQYSGDYPWILDPKTNRIVGIQHPDGSRSEFSFAATNAPQLLASVDEDAYIEPYRLVTFINGVTPFQMHKPYTAGTTVVGVTSGYTNADGYHANPGEPITLQNTDLVQVTCGEDYEIDLGDLLAAEPSTGSVIPSSAVSAFIGDNAPNNPILRALESATYGQVFWAQKIGGWSTAAASASFTGPGVTVNTQAFNYGDASLIWTKPAGAVWVEMTCVGGGMNGQTATTTKGGNGGGAGRVMKKTVPATLLPNTLTVWCGERAAYGPTAFAGVTYVASTEGVICSALGGGGPNNGLHSTRQGWLSGERATLEIGAATQVTATPIPAPSTNTGFSSFVFGAGGLAMGDDQGYSGPGRDGSVDGPGGGGAGGSSTGGFTAGSAGGRGGSGQLGGGGIVYPSLFPNGGASGGNGANGTGGSTSTISYVGNGAGGGGYATTPTTGVGGTGGSAIRGGGGGGGGAGAIPGVGGLGGHGCVVIRTLCWNT